MKLFSFYGSVAELDTEAELRLSILWRERWSAIGFEPVILNSYIAQKHPYYPEFYEAVSKLPTCNPKSYEIFCHERHLALVVAGGGFMADLDVMPAADFKTVRQAMITPIEGRTDQMHIYQTPCCPSLFYCRNDVGEAICRELAKGGSQPQGERAHVSDQYTLEALAIQKSPLVAVHDVVKQYPDEGWQKAALVHLPNAAMQPRGKTPKWKHIPEILKEKGTDFSQPAPR